MSSSSAPGAQSVRDTPSTSAPRRALPRALAAIAAVALGAGLAVVGAAAPASAHHNTISGEILCEADGSASIEWSVTNSEAKTETITHSSNTAVVPVGTTLAKRETAVFTQEDAAVGTHTLKLSAEWSNGATDTSSSGAVKVTDESCGEDAPVVKKITFCHATSSETNPYVRITTSVNAFFKSGHIDHERDIWPTFTYQENGKNGKIVTVEAQGDQTLLAYEDCRKPKPREIELPAKPDSVDRCGVEGDRIVEPEALTGVVWSISPVVDGTATATATAEAGYVFADGSTKKTWNYEFTNEPCVIEVPVPAKPASTDVCGVLGDGVELPEDTDQVTWSLDGDPKTGAATAVATAAKGHVFAGGATTQRFEYEFTNEPCPVVIAEPVKPASVDRCGVDLDAITIPGDDEQLAWTVEGVAKSGAATAVATAKPGFTFADGTTERRFEFSFTDEPCPIELPVPAAPASVDRCGVDDDAVTLPADTDTVTWAVEGDPKSGTATAVATAATGHVFENGETTARFEYAFDTTECQEPSLLGSTATAMCRANSPWIVFDVVLTDPDAQSTGNIAYLVLSDGTHTEKVELGPIGEDGRVAGEVLWPGAAVDEAGNPTAWPGWMQLPNGRWVVTDGNFGWTRSLTSATIEVNPTLAIDLDYPTAADCAPTSRPAGTGVTPIDNGEGSGLASTGFAGGTVAIVAGGLVLAGGIALTVMYVIRRKRA